MSRIYVVLEFDSTSDRGVSVLATARTLARACEAAADHADILTTELGAAERDLVLEPEPDELADVRKAIERMRTITRWGGAMAQEGSNVCLHFAIDLLATQWEIMAADLLD